MNKNNLLIIGFIMLGILTRVIPHPPNFTAIGAIALFGGAFIKEKRLALIIPTIIMLISDLIMGYELILSVYISFIIMVSLGWLLRLKQTIWKIINISVLGSLLFFLITNFSVFLTSSMYPKSIIGLIECYTLAIPFFINTLLANVIYSIIMFYSFKIIKEKIILISR
tara:strand:- start:437 stop:940 length:504 start_codon:yes stop_codon:yes gene_type:complete